MAKNETEILGVFYRPEDYLSVGKRLLIDTVDTLVALVVSIGLTVAFALLLPEGDVLGVAILATWTLVWSSYFVFLKRSSYRTLRYRLAGARVVNLQGETPSVASLVGRLLFVVGGPVNFFLDLVWISSDPARQAVRDKFAHTYVIKKEAVPAGRGKVVYRTYLMFGTAFLFQEVQGATAAAP
jgi:uncharacterized RDD family membrane protein YckC